MIKERIDKLIEMYESRIYENQHKIKLKSEIIVYRLKHDNDKILKFLLMILRN